MVATAGYENVSNGVTESLTTLHYIMRSSRVRSRRFLSIIGVAAICLNTWPSHTAAQPPKTTPKMLFGHSFGDDYWLANYAQLIQYWQQVAKESDRIRLHRIGTTWYGRPMWMAIISSPENLRRLGRYRSIVE